MENKSKVVFKHDYGKLETCFLFVHDNMQPSADLGDIKYFLYYFGL